MFFFFYNIKFETLQIFFYTTESALANNMLKLPQSQSPQNLTQKQKGKKISNRFICYTSALIINI